MMLGAAPAGAQQGAPIDDLTEILPEGVPVPFASPSQSPSSSSSPGAVASGKRGNVSRKVLDIGFGDLLYEGSAGQRAAAMNETVAANAGVVRLGAIWRNIAPASPGATFDAANPLSPGYNWSQLDAAVQDASARGLRPIILVNLAPDWAEAPGRPGSVEPGTWKPNPADVKDFGAAIARRYSGSVAGQPAVRDFQLWAEPNLETNLNPIWKGKSGKKPAVSTQYRKMLNGFYAGVHGVRGKGANVITGGTAPYGADPGVLNMRPLLFWRKVMCVKDNKRLSPVKKCKKPKFDVLAHHPINTSGGPGVSAINDDDVSTPDLHNLVKVLRSAEKAGNVKPGGRRPVWATEIWWESDPPDPFKSNPGVGRQAKWYSESLYSLWKQGASMVLFLQVRDAPYDGEPGRFNGNFQTGVRFADGKPKPANKAVSFPFFADRKSKKKVLLWGKAPKGGKLLIQQKKGKRTKTIARTKVKGGKVFTTKTKLKKGKGKYKLRAKIGGQKSLFSKLK